MSGSLPLSQFHEPLKVLRVPTDANDWFNRGDATGFEVPSVGLKWVLACDTVYDARGASNLGICGGETDAVHGGMGTNSGACTKEGGELASAC